MTVHWFIMAMLRGWIVGPPNPFESLNHPTHLMKNAILALSRQVMASVGYFPKSWGWKIIPKNVLKTPPTLPKANNIATKQVKKKLVTLITRRNREARVVSSNITRDTGQCWSHATDGNCKCCICLINLSNQTQRSDILWIGRVWASRAFQISMELLSNGETPVCRRLGKACKCTLKVLIPFGLGTFSRAQGRIDWCSSDHPRDWPSSPSGLKLRMPGGRRSAQHVSYEWDLGIVLEIIKVCQGWKSP